MSTHGIKAARLDERESSFALFMRILKFMLPLIATNLLQEFYHASDIMIVGLSSEPDAIGAVGATTSFLSLIKNIFIGFSVGVNVVVARFIGRGDNDGASRAAHTSICMSMLFGVIGSVIGIALTRPVLTLMGYEGKLLELAIRYAYIVLACMPFLSLTNFLSGILHAKGNTKTSLYVLTLTGILNIALNALFVLVCGLSVEGVAIATAIANLVSSIVLWIYLARDAAFFKIGFKALRIDTAAFCEIARVGFPAGLQNALFSISNLLISSSIVQVNNAVTPPGSEYAPIMKGHSASGSIESFIFQALAAVTTSASVFTARCVGAEDYRAARRTFSMLCIVSAAIAVLFSSLAILLRDPLLALYNVHNAEDTLSALTYGAAMSKMFWKWPLFFVYALMNAASGTLRGFGKSSLAAIIALFGTCVLRVIWILTVFRFFPTLEIIFISYPISWFVTGAVFFVIIAAIFKKRIGESRTKD